VEKKRGEKEKIPKGKHKRAYSQCHPFWGEVTKKMPTRQEGALQNLAAVSTTKPDRNTKGLAGESLHK